jgi:hypothetical protein
VTQLPGRDRHPGSGGHDAVLDDELERGHDAVLDDELERGHDAVLDGELERELDGLDDGLDGLDGGSRRTRSPGGRSLHPLSPRSSDARRRIACTVRSRTRNRGGIGG